MIHLLPSRLWAGAVLVSLLALGAPAPGTAQVPQGGDSVLASPRMTYDAHPWRAAIPHDF
jgi:hypothetical protein